MVIPSLIALSWDYRSSTPPHPHLPSSTLIPTHFLNHILHAYPPPSVTSHALNPSITVPPTYFTYQSSSPNHCPRPFTLDQIPNILSNDFLQLPINRDHPSSLFLSVLLPSILCRLSFLPCLPSQEIWNSFWIGGGEIGVNTSHLPFCES